MQLTDKVKFYEAQLETLEREKLNYEVTIDFYGEVEAQGLTPEEKKGEAKKAEAALALTEIKLGILEKKLRIYKRLLPKKPWYSL